MLTVPAQIFCAPTRAKLIAAARFMPGVCAVLVSRELPGITFTPCSFQSILSWLWSWLMRRLSSTRRQSGEEVDDELGERLSVHRLRPGMADPVQRPCDDRRGAVAPARHREVRLHAV